MKLVIQKVKKAKVEVKNNVVGQIDKGYMVFPVLLLHLKVIMFLFQNL